LSLDASWKWIYLTTWYQYVKNSLTIVTQAYNDETRPGVTIIDHQAILDSYSYRTMLTLAPRFGIWQPQLTTGVYFWDSDLEAILKDDALSVTLIANDIFHTQHNAMTAYSIGTSTTFTEYYDHQRVGVTLSYKFNATKSKYKGTGAGQSEKSRL
jgi:hypothetical protein